MGYSLHPDVGFGLGAACTTDDVDAAADGLPAGPALATFVLSVLVECDTVTAAGAGAGCCATVVGADTDDTSA